MFQFTKKKSKQSIHWCKLAEDSTLTTSTSQKEIKGAANLRMSCPLNLKYKRETRYEPHKFVLLRLQDEMATETNLSKHKMQTWTSITPTMES